LLKILSQKYKLYILSNTSELHIEYFTKLFNDTAGYAMKDVFTECFYSHEIGIHKPDPEAFLHVAEKGNILAEETLFLDDNIHNVKAAGELGFNVIHISNQLKMEDVGYNR
jgi:putative hydrolase of the HAD superfamily